jgi:ABC-2 type transport system permease protein
MAGICWALVRAGLRAEMQFRANFLVEVAFGLVYQTIGFAFIWVVLGRFEAIGGWTLQEVTLLYGIQLMGHALWALSFSRIVNVQAMVQIGEFDTMLIRPMPIALQFMFGGFRIAIVGDVLGAVVLLGAGLRGSDIDWSPARVVFLVLAVIGSGLVRGAFELACCSLVFRTLVRGWAQSATSRLFGQFGAYPLDIFGRALRNFMTWVIPGPHGGAAVSGVGGVVHAVPGGGADGRRVVALSPRVAALPVVRLVTRSPGMSVRMQGPTVYRSLTSSFLCQPQDRHAVGPYTQRERVGTPPIPPSCHPCDFPPDAAPSRHLLPAPGHRDDRRE